MSVPKTPQAQFLVERTTERQTTRCKKCGELPIYRRVKRVQGVGRFSHSDIYCEICGVQELEKLKSTIDSLIAEVNSFNSVLKGAR